MSLKIIAILGGVILVLSTLLFIQKGRLKRVVEERNQAIDFTLAKDDQIQYLSTKLGQETAKSEILELTNRNLNRLQDDKELAWLKEIKAINKRMNNVEQVMSTTAYAAWNFKLSLQDTLITLARKDSSSLPSSIRARKFNNHDRWISLSGYILPDTLVVTPSVTVPLKSVVYWERRKGIFGLRIGRKEWFKETTSPNPYVRITENKLIRVIKKKRKTL